MTFIPSGGAEPPEDFQVTNDGFFPDLSLNDFKAQMGVGDAFDQIRLVHLITAAMLEINESLKIWRDTVTAYPSLEAIPADLYGGTSAKVMHYRNAVYSRAKALFIERTRDYDSTKSGHEEADQLSDVADDYFRQSTESLSRLMDQPRTNVELI